MNQNGNNSGKPFNPDDSFPDFRAPIAPALAAKPDFQRFPTVEELLDTQNPHPFLRLAEPPVPRPPSYGLLQELLGGRLDVLISDVLKHPERYDEDTRDLLETLGNEPAKMQKMNATEQQMLNRAVIDYAAFKPKGVVAPKPKPVKIPKVLQPTYEDEEPAEEHGPGGPMSSFWWLSNL